MPTAVKTLWGLLLLTLCGCSLRPAALTPRIALLAPFEGQYRAIGYNALYAARLGLADTLVYDLLAVDDGGTVASAVSRGRALALDPQVMGVLLVGPFATASDVQNALAPLPTVLIGSWSTTLVSASAVQLAPPDVSAVRTTLTISTDDERADRPDAWQLTTPQTSLAFLSPGNVPDATYTSRYQALGEFTPSPNTLATLTTDAVALLIASHTQSIPLRTLDITLLNGRFTFTDGYWTQAHLTLYRYTPNGTLTATPLD